MLGELDAGEGSARDGSGSTLPQLKRRDNPQMHQRSCDREE
jgi:hypothetical protein